MGYHGIGTSVATGHAFHEARLAGAWRDVYGVMRGNLPRDESQWFFREIGRAEMRRVPSAPEMRALVAASRRGFPVDVLLRPLDVVGAAIMLASPHHRDVLPLAEAQRQETEADCLTDAQQMVVSYDSSRPQCERLIERIKVQMRKLVQLEMAALEQMRRLDAQHGPTPTRPVERAMSA